jgi:O-antigen/teichoic acid export membrane protein
MGANFLPAGWTISLLSPIVLFIAWSNVIGTQYLMPINRTKDFTISVTVGAFVNILLNFITIPLWGLYGAAIATVISEVAVTIYQFWVVRYDLFFAKLFNGVWKYFVAGIVMFIVLLIMTINMAATPARSVIQIVVGIIIYFSLTILLRANFIGNIKKFIAEHFNK